MSCSEPLAGPGPAAPAATGTPVSATVGVIVGTVLASTLGSGGIADEGGDAIGIWVGDKFSACGLIGGDCVL